MKRLLLTLLADARAAFSWRIGALVGLMVLSGLLEGLAVTAALPLLGALGAPGGAGLGGFVGLLARVPMALGLPEGPVGVGVLMVGLITLSAVAFLAQARLAAALQVRYVLGWQNRVFAAALAAGPAFLDARRGGDVVAAIVADATRVGGAFYHGCLVLAAGVNLAIYVVLAVLVSPATSLAVMALGIVLFLATRPFLRRAFGFGQSITRAQGDVQALAGEGVSASKALKANAAEAAAAARFEEAAGRLAEANFHSSFDVQKAKAVFEFGGAAGIAGLLIAGPLLFGVEVATVLVVLALFVRLLPRVTALQQGLQALGVLLPALSKLDALHREARAAAEPDDPRPLPLALAGRAPGVVFRNVTIRRGETRALDGVDLEIPAGKIVALVGPSGSGKSTLVDALLGLVPVTFGKVEVAGMPLADIPMPAWRRAIGYVAQDTALLSGSVADNVRLGTEASPAAVEAALERAAARFVRGLAAGIDTEVGDRGARLSGGERQRLGLARALAAPRLLYVLDEATSALDSETEAEVVRAVARLSGDATIVVVAHRFSAVRDADLIHVLEAGRVVESGTWAALDRPGTRFFALKSLQDTASRTAAPIEGSG